MILTLKLFLAHFIGDFVIQPSGWVRHKQEKGLGSPYLYLHILIHGLVLTMLLQFDWEEYRNLIAIYAVSHLVIDALKITLEKLRPSIWWFWLDQLAHMAIVVGISRTMHHFEFEWSILDDPKVLVSLLSLVLVTGVSAIVLKVIMNRWNVKRFSIGSLPNAGLYIGILERLFVFTFVVMNHWQAIGFLIAAKSAFRFGDLTKAKNKKLTEYVLIGTLMSFGLAILIGLTHLYLMKITIK